MVKKAPVCLRMTEAITPGKFLVLVDGEVADVECAFDEGVAVARSGLIDKLFLPHASPPLALALQGALPKGPLDSLGLVETHSVASVLLAADAALKAAEVRLVKLELARGIGGKGYCPHRASPRDARQGDPGDARRRLGRSRSSRATPRRRRVSAMRPKR
jgi:microcompartment protein CcmL/EutN